MRRILMYTSSEKAFITLSLCLESHNGCSTEDVADRLGCDVRTARRQMQFVYNMSHVLSMFDMTLKETDEYHRRYDVLNVGLK